MCFLQESQWPNFIAVDDVGYKKEGGERKIVLDINKNNKACCCCAIQSPLSGSGSRYEDNDNDYCPNEESISIQKVNIDRKRSVLLCVAIVGGAGVVLFWLDQALDQVMWHLLQNGII